MSFWTPENKQKAVELYQEQSPTPETSMEIIKQVAEDLGQTVNGVRMILVQAGVYVKKDAAASTTSSKPKEAGKSTRVSKEDSIAALKTAIEAKGKEVDEDILSKLTGKAAVYFLSVISE